MEKDNVNSAKLGFENQLLNELVISRYNVIANNENPDEVQDPVVIGKASLVEAKFLTRFIGAFRFLFQRLKRGRIFEALLKRAYGIYISKCANLNYRFRPEIYFQGDVNNYSDIDYLYSKLKNKQSKDLLVKLFAYRILGHTKVKLPRNNEKYWRGIEGVAKYKSMREDLKIDFLDATLANYDLQPIGYSLNAYASATGLACAFVQKQYEYDQDGVKCKAEKGDIAIDAGGCWGETTLYFAHEVGEEGKVYSFEFIPNNLAVMKKNISCNPILAPRIELVEAAMWSYSDKELYYLDWGPGSQVFDSPIRKDLNYGECKTLSIDDLVARKQLPKVDFIKMDIEGAELPALKGAENTIKKYRPKLAISIYHQVSDFITIPKYLDALSLDYSFYLDHHTIYLNETVLFAVPNAAD